MTDEGKVCPTCRISLPLDAPFSPLCTLCAADKRRHSNPNKKG